MPLPKASESKMSITATSFCRNFNVIFFNSLFPINAPEIAASVAQITNVIFSCNPDLLNLLA